MSAFLITAKLAFGKTVPVATVPTAGISKITAVDFEYAKILRCTIKLLGTAMASASDTTSEGSDAAVSKLSVFVSPAMVPLSSPLASAKGAGNMVSFTLFLQNKLVLLVICDVRIYILLCKCLVRIMYTGAN